MAYSYVLYTGNGTTTNFAFPFPYLQASDVKVRVNGNSVSYTFLNSSTVTISPAPAIGDVVEIRRETLTLGAPVDFTDGSVLLEKDLDLIAKYNLFTSQETQDIAKDSIAQDTSGNLDAKNRRIVNVANPVNPNDAVNKFTLGYEYPKVSSVADNMTDVKTIAADLGAAVSYESDLGSITDPISSGSLAGGSRIDVVATNIADVITVADNISIISSADENAASALASATSASSSAASASTSASTAVTKASEASSSSTAAAASATSASTSASTATTKATEAASSASTASGAASTATTKATEAANSALSAASSATTATTQATNAANSANAAGTSANSASISASSASGSASTATTKASEASASATSAAGSATTATTKAGEAATSATNAAASASTATTKASEAASSATAASASATSASAAQVAAETARDQTLAAYDNFDDRYLGAKTSDPTVDNDGNALLAGALYFNSTLGYMKVYTGSLWVDAYAAGSSFLAKANNLSDLPNVSTARTNLGLGTAATQNTSAFATSAQGALADSAVQTGGSYANPSWLTSVSSAKITGLGSLALKSTVTTTDITDASITDTKLAATLDLGSI